MQHKEINLSLLNVLKNPQNCDVKILMLQYFKIFIKFCTSNDHLLEETRRWNSALNERFRKKVNFC